MPKISELPTNTGTDYNSLIPVVVDGVTTQTELEDITDLINVKKYGAMGDGTTDDTTAIQAAITAGAGKTIYIPSGTYKITGTLVISAANTRVMGAGPSTRIFQYTANTDHFHLRPTTYGTTADFLNLPMIDNMTLICTSAALASTSGAALRITQCAAYKVHNIWFGASAEGVVVEGGQAGEIRGLWGYAAGSADLKATDGTALLHFKQAPYGASFQSMFTTEVSNFYLSGGGLRDTCIRIADCDGLHLSNFYINGSTCNSIIKIAGERTASYVAGLSMSLGYLDGLSNDTNIGISISSDAFTNPIYHVYIDKTVKIAGCVYGIVSRKTELYGFSCSAQIINNEHWAIDIEGGPDTSIKYDGITHNNGTAGASGDIRLSGSGGKNFVLNGWVSGSAENVVLLVSGAWESGTITGCLNNTSTVPDIANTATFTNNLIMSGNTSGFTANADQSWRGTSFGNSSTTDPNVLDWYEEGTFVPVLRFGGATTGITYSTATGYYQSVGKFTQFTCKFVLTNKGAQVGIATMSGLPYAAVQDDPVSLRITNITAGVADQAIQAFIQGSTGAIRFDKFAAGGTLATQMTDADFTNTTEVILSGTYYSG